MEWDSPAVLGIDLVTGHQDPPDEDWVISPGCVEGSVAAVAISLGIKSFPEDLQQLYKLTDGIGLRDGDEIDWVVPPVDDFVPYVESCRNRIGLVSRSEAARFLPFFFYGQR